MNVREAATLIGCSQEHVRYLCREKRIKGATKKQSHPQGRFEFDIPLEGIKSYLQREIKVGWKRGRTRK